MASTPPSLQDHTPYSTPPTRLLTLALPRRTLSFSSSSPSHSCYSSTSSPSSSPFFSFNDIETPPFSPITTSHLKGIPFSWEQVPGIPKHHHLQHFKINHSSVSPHVHHLLPPPPPKKLPSQDREDHISPNPKNKLHLHHSSNRFQIRGDHDPFLAAFLECSKDDDGGGIWRSSSKVISRTLSDRLGFISMYTSCKSTCAVSESIVHLPRPTPHYLVNHRRRH